MFSEYAKHFHSEIPTRPSGKYAHLIVLRRTESYAVFKTDGELNTTRVAAGVEDTAMMTRLTLFKRKQSTPERLTGRELLRRYGIYEGIFQATNKKCEYNEAFCGECPDDVLYGYAIGDSGSEKSKVYTDSAYSLTSYDESHETFTLNAPYEDGTMTKGDKTTNRFSEQDHVLPGVYFPSVVTLRDPTPGGLAYVINNLRRTKLYGAQTTRTGHMENQILAIIFADGEIFSNLRLTQLTHDKLKVGNVAVATAVLEAAKEQVSRDGVVYEILTGDPLSKQLNELDAVFTNEANLKQFLQQLAKEARTYSVLVGVVPDSKAKSKAAKPTEG